MPQGPPARTVGARLREAREKRGVSLRQIADSTRISVMSLEALERSDLSRLPGGIFTRAFIRAYAQEVGLDPDRTIQDFIAELPPEAATATAHPAAVEDGEKLDSERRAVATAIRLVLVSLPIIGLVVYYGARRAPVADRRHRNGRRADGRGSCSAAGGRIGLAAGAGRSRTGIRTGRGCCPGAALRPDHGHRPEGIVLGVGDGRRRADLLGTDERRRQADDHGQRADPRERWRRRSVCLHLERARGAASRCAWRSREQADHPVQPARFLDPLMDVGIRSPLLDFFRRGEVAKDVRLLAARGRSHRGRTSRLRCWRC